MTSGSPPQQRASCPAQNHPKARQYRAAKPLPRDLREHCSIYFEEELFGAGLALLSNLLLSGLSQQPPGAPAVPCFVAPPDLLSIVATLAIHPAFCAPDAPDDKLQVASQAFALLKQVNYVVGPANAQLSRAFRFEARSRNRACPDGDAAARRLSTTYAQNGSLWNTASDFWHVVGWAFNCSVLHRERWTTWQLWLDWIIEVLEDDWFQRLYIGIEEHSSDHDRAQLVSDSLVFQYARGSGLDRARSRTRNPIKTRRILCAVMANGSFQDKREFPEVFTNELKYPRENKSTKIQRRRINLDEGDFADYDERADDEDGIEKSISASGKSFRMEEEFVPEPHPLDATLDSDGLESSADVVHAGNNYGGTKAVILRRRLLALLAGVADVLQEEFIPLEDLCEMVASDWRQLPLSCFTIMIFPSQQGFTPPNLAMVVQSLLRLMLADNAPAYHGLANSQTILEEYYLPYAAVTESVIDNIKVSLANESLLRILNDYYSPLIPSDRLRDSIRTGIHARHSKANVAVVEEGSNMVDANAELARALQASSNRLRLIAKNIEKP